MRLHRRLLVVLPVGLPVCVVARRIAVVRTGRPEKPADRGPGGSPQFSCGARVFLVSGLADVAVATRARGGALCPLRHAGRGIRPGSIPRSGSLKSHNARLSAVTRPFVQFRAFLELSRKQCVLASVADRPVCVAPSRLGLSTLFRYTSGFVTARMSGGRAGPGGVLAVCRIDRTELGGE